MTCDKVGETVAKHTANQGPGNTHRSAIDALTRDRSMWALCATVNRRRASERKSDTQPHSNQERAVQNHNTVIPEKPPEGVGSAGTGGQRQGCRRRRRGLVHGWPARRTAAWRLLSSCSGPGPRKHTSRGPQPTAPQLAVLCPPSQSCPVDSKFHHMETHSCFKITLNSVCLALILL